MRSTKKVVSIVMAVACLMALSIPAFAAGTLPDTANMYVTPEDNTLQPVSALGLTAYLTGETDGTYFPTTPNTNNATITTSGTTTTVEISMTSDFVRFVSFPSSTPTVEADGTALPAGSVTTEVTGTAVNSDGVTYATEVTYTFYNGTYSAGTAYRIEGCTIYAENSLIAALNGGKEHVLPVTMMGE